MSGPIVNNSLEKILLLLDKSEDSHCQLAIRKFIYKHLEDMIDDTKHVDNDSNNRLDIVINKFKQIFLSQEIEKYFILPTQYKQKDDKLTILGIDSLPNLELNYEEKKLLKSIVEKQLLESINSYLTKYEENGGNLTEVMKKKESLAKEQLLKMNDLDILHWKNKIDEICKAYCQDINTCHNLLNEWQRLKYEDMKTLNQQKAQSILLQNQVTDLQTRIVKLQYSLQMFRETPETLEAFEILDRKLEEKLMDIQTEVKNKKLLSKQYHDLLGTEYDDILNKYLELRAIIKKDERLLSSL
ncbi:uncharacterized protein [Chelonus insularis]|uniref:uncharacterized protein n=1 Tax=Chelonus insularis TaxID=460826 RepID=UPI001588DF5F|nr:uncharacterized protein LOC118071861 [Chelonus insularis]